MKAKAREDSHSRITGEVEGLPVVGMDYAYYGNDEPRNLKPGERDEGKTEKKVTILVMKDAKSGMLFGETCISKGSSDDWIVRRVCRNIESLGRSNIMVKTDGEPALVQIQAGLIPARTAQTLPNNPPAYNPESNGVVEKGVQDVIAHVRLLKLALESRLEIEIDAHHPIMEWLLVHATFILSRFAVGHDGKTPWERLTGKAWRRPLVEFAEQVHGKLARQRMAKHQGRSRPGINRKLSARWLEGTWVGQDPRTGEHILVTRAGRAVRVRTIRRMPVSNRWAKDVVLAVRSTPRFPDPRKQEVSEQAVEAPTDESMVEVSAQRPEPHVPVEPERPKPIPRDSDLRELRLTRRMFEKFGYSTVYGIQSPGCAA